MKTKEIKQQIETNKVINIKIINSKRKRKMSNLYGHKLNSKYKKTKTKRLINYLISSQAITLKTICKMNKSKAFYKILKIKYKK